MPTYTVSAVDGQTAARVRETLLSPDHDHPAHVEVASEPAPCRVCLTKFAPGEDRRILFTYDPFRDVEKLPLPGPIFIHEPVCAPYTTRSRFPAELAADQLTFVAYGDGREPIGDVRTSAAEDVDETTGRLLGELSVRYIHVRSTPAGCYICRLDPAVGR